MFRRLFTVLSALSLVLCVAVCELWVRSFRVGDFADLELTRPAHRLQPLSFAASGTA
jgi:hypothetical protein